MTTYQNESWQQFFPDCMPLFAQHEAEIGEIDPRMPYDPDWDGAKALYDAGLLFITTAREHGTLQGYCLFLVARSMRSKNILCGTQMFYFLTKSARKGGRGAKLYQAAIDALKAYGVKNIYPHHWLRADSPKAGDYFKSMGAVELEHEYSLWIGD